MRCRALHPGHGERSSRHPQEVPISRKTERFLNLTICLLASRRPVTREQIRQAVPGYAGLSDAAFQRMFERDKEELRRISVPIETEPVESWGDEEYGYRIRPDAFSLPPLDLTPAEATVIGLAAQMWQEATIADTTRSALRKLRAAGAPVSTERVTALTPTLPTREQAFPVVWAALLARNRLSFTYHDRRRVVEPWRLIQRRGAWYLLAAEDGRPKWFKLSRCQDLPVLVGSAGAFQPPAASAMREIAAGLEPPQRPGSAVVAVRGEAVGRLRRRGEVIDDPRCPEGYDAYRVDFGNPDEVLDEVIGAGAEALILEPETMRDEIVARLLAVAQAGRVEE